MHLLDTINRPVVSDKSFQGMEKGVYVFKVHPGANKYQVRTAVETAFGVKVKQVRILNVIGKKRRFGRHLGKRPDWKKAYVTLQEGQRIQELSETL